MMFLPRALSNIADGRNALNRLTRVFYAEILTDVPFVINPSQGFALEVKDVSFDQWPTCGSAKNAVSGRSPAYSLRRH